jgi:hypothetical protein
MPILSEADNTRAAKTKQRTGGTAMSVTYNTTLKNARLTDVVAAIDTGGAGYLEIGDTAMAHVLSTIHFNTVCGVVVGGVLTISGTPLVDASAAQTGTAAEAEVFSGGNTLIISGLTVGTSGCDINLSSTSIVAGQSVTLTSASVTHG